MSGSRKILIVLAAIGVLLGIAAAATNFIEDEVGWNTTFTVLQTIIVAALMVIVARDGADEEESQAELNKIGNAA